MTIRNEVPCRSLSENADAQNPVSGPARCRPSCLPSFPSFLLLSENADAQSPVSRSTSALAVVKMS